MPQQVIETARLRLRLPRMCDAEPLFRSYASDPAVARYVQWSTARTVEDVQDFLRSVLIDWDQGSHFQWVIADFANDVPFGMISMRIDAHGAMIGYALSRDCWGRGFATEAAQAVVDVAFADPGISRVGAYCDVKNPASARVMEKIGMIREGILRRFAPHPNISVEPRDVLAYAIVRADLAPAGSRPGGRNASASRQTQVIHGARVGAQGVISTGSTAAIFNEDRSAILLTRRSDNGRWCLPGGRLEPGESLWEACQREVREETGLQTELVRLIGVYSSPDWLIEYPDGNRMQIVSCFFEARAMSGELTLSNETTGFGYFTLLECATLDIIENHVERIRDAFANVGQPFVD